MEANLHYAHEAAIDDMNSTMSRRRSATQPQHGRSARAVRLDTQAEEHHRWIRSLERRMAERGQRFVPFGKPAPATLDPCKQIDVGLLLRLRARMNDPATPAAHRVSLERVLRGVI